MIYGFYYFYKLLFLWNWCTDKNAEVIFQVYLWKWRSFGCSQGLPIVIQSFPHLSIPLYASELTYVAFSFLSFPFLNCNCLTKPKVFHTYFTWSCLISGVFLTFVLFLIIYSECVTSVQNIWPNQFYWYESTNQLQCRKNHHVILQLINESLWRDLHLKGF